MKMTTDNQKSKGKIICTRIVKYDEVISLVKTLSVDEAVKKLMKTEQDNWKSVHLKLLQENNWQNSFFRDCFPKWTYILDGVECTTEDIKKAVTSGVVWNIELKVEYDPKLTAYKLLNKKDNE